MNRPCQAPACRAEIPGDAPAMKIYCDRTCQLNARRYRIRGGLPQITIRLDVPTYQALADEARAEGLTPAEWAAAILTDELGLIT